MNFLLKFSMLMAAAALSGCGSALWHPWIDKQVAGASISKQEASLKPIKMVRPSASAPAKHARWWGYWHGWYGYDKETDMKIVFARIEADEAVIQYAWATDSKALSTVLRGRFVGDEVQVQLTTGGYLSMRLRPNGSEMEVVRRTGYSGVALDYYGLLTRQPEPALEKPTNR